MKFGLFIALLVLVASTDVFGEKTKISINRPTSDEKENVDQVKITEGNGDRSSSSPVKVTVGAQREGQRERSNPVEIEIGRKSSSRADTVRDETKPVEIEVNRKPIVRVDTAREENRPVEAEVSRKPTIQLDTAREETKPVENEVNRKPIVRVDTVRERIQPVTVIREETKPTVVEVLHKPEEHIEIQHNDESLIPEKTVTRPVEHLEELHEENVKPTAQISAVRPQESHEEEAGRLEHHEEESRRPEHHEEGHAVDNDAVDDTKRRGPFAVAVPVTENIRRSENTVHVSGRIVLVKYHSTAIDSVQYDLDGGRLINGGRPLNEPRSPFAQDILSSKSRITLYVSTSKTIDRKLSFAQFPIDSQRDHFPISFDIDVELPSQQRGLLERADVTLYFFVYVNNLETRIDTFLPAGTSQILLQGTNRLVQKLDVYVKASGIEVHGLFRGRFGQRFISADTAFQVFIVAEQSLSHFQTQTFESVAQLTINNLPAMYPVPFSLLVNHQSLRPNTRYYAVAYIVQNGVQRLINQQPIMIINRQKVLVTSQVIFTVTPSPFILSGAVTRVMPGAYYLPPHSSLILRLREIGSNTSDIIFKLPDIVTLPQLFQINISESVLFDPSKNYDMRALITDEKNDIYMASLQRIPLLDEITRLTVPVDDLLYYVQVRLHASSNQLLNFIPGSTAQVFVTETPETPTAPIVSIRIDSVTSNFHEFSLQVPSTAIQRGHNYYLVMLIEMNGMITHISKSLLISNNQPPPLVIQLPVLSLNLISGIIFDDKNRHAQWSSSSVAKLYLVEDKVDNPAKSIVQVWTVHLENDFPVRFEVQLDFSLLRRGVSYRLQAAIENGRDILEYQPAGSVLALNGNAGIITGLRIPVQNVKTMQLVKGLIYINDFNTTLPEKGEIIVQLSSSPSLSHPSIIDEIRIKVEERTLPIDFSMNLPLNKIDITSVYYFLVRYVVRDNVIIPATQAFAFSPRNDATVVLTLSRTPQIPITGQVTSTGSPLILPAGATLHLYITDSADTVKPTIFSEVYLQASANSLYEFTMNIDSQILRQKIELYLRADIIYRDTIILSIPRPALLQITPGGEWNINLVVDLPTLLIGEIISMSQQEKIGGDFEVFIQILERGTTHVVHTSRLRLGATFPQKFRIEIDNELFIQYAGLQARAIIKNCKEQILFEAAGLINIHTGLNIKADLPVVLTNPQKFKELQVSVNEIASLHIGVWRLSVTGTVTGPETGLVVAGDSGSRNRIDDNSDPRDL